MEMDTSILCAGQVVNENILDSDSELYEINDNKVDFYCYIAVIQIQADSVQVLTVLLSSDFTSSTQGERHNS